MKALFIHFSVFHVIMPIVITDIDVNPVLRYLLYAQPLQVPFAIWNYQSRFWKRFTRDRSCWFQKLCL